jgi:hypothetical protein
MTTLVFGVFAKAISLPSRREAESANAEGDKMVFRCFTKRNHNRHL